MYFLNDRFTEVNVEITNLCNFNCWFCPREAMTRKKGVMEYGKFEEMVLSLNSGNFLKEIALAGIGEPTLHPDLLRMIAFIKHTTPFKVVLTTNASRFRDRAFVEELFKTKVDKVTVSLRISDEHRENLPSNIAYDDYVESILDFVKTKYRMDCRTEIELAFFKESYFSKHVLGIPTADFINTKRLNGFFKKLAQNLDEELPTYDEFTEGIASHLSNVARLSLREGLSLRFDSLSSWTTAVQKYKLPEARHRSRYGSCLGLLTHFAIYWNGDVSTCCADFDARNILGNIFEEKDIIKILSSRKAVAFAKSLRDKRMPTETCQICRGGKNFAEKCANMLGTMFFMK